jgi:hypothetical protein
MPQPDSLGNTADPNQEASHTGPPPAKCLLVISHGFFTGLSSFLRRLGAYLKDQVIWGYARGQYAAKWSWKAVCPQYIKVPKAQAVLVALDSDCDLTRNSDCDLSEFIHGFVGGHRGDENSTVPLAVANRTAAQTRNAYEIVLKCRFEKLALPLLTLKSIAMKHHGASQKDFRLRNNFGECYSSQHTGYLCKALAAQGWKPTPSWAKGEDADDICDWISLLCKDNKEFYFSLKHVRIRNGKKEESVLYHTVTGEYLPLQRSRFADLEHLPRDSVWLPRSEQIDLSTKFPIPIHDANSVLQRVFDKKVNLVRTDPQLVLGRPAPSEDKWHGSHQTTFHEPVMLDIGTVYQQDCESVMMDVLARFPGLIVVGCDNQFFKNCWSVQCANPDKCKRLLLLPGELHGHMHLVHAIFLANWTYIMEPICLLLGATKVHIRKFLAKEHNEKQRLMFLTFTAGIKWLVDMGLDSTDLSDIPAFLEKIKKNQPGYDFVFFLFYYANHYVESVNATRTSDTDYADFTWIYSLYIYGITNKNHYKMLCLLFGQVAAHTNLHMC